MATEEGAGPCGRENRELDRREWLVFHSDLVLVLCSQTTEDGEVSPARTDSREAMTEQARQPSDVIFLSESRESSDSDSNQEQQENEEVSC